MLNHLLKLSHCSNAACSKKTVAYLFLLVVLQVLLLANHGNHETKWVVILKFKLHFSLCNNVPEPESFVLGFNFTCIVYAKVSVSKALGPGFRPDNLITCGYTGIWSTCGEEP